MASLYKRDNSPYWYIKYRNSKTGKIEREPTGFKHGVLRDTEQARSLQAEKTLQERTLTPAKESERWELWVPSYLKYRYTKSEFTLVTRECWWRTLEQYLADIKVEIPRQLTREHFTGYVAWRTTDPDPKRHKYSAGVESAKQELKLLRILVEEAHCRSYIATSPCTKMRIENNDDGPLKPELTQEMREFTAQQIAKVKDAETRKFYTTSDLIARYHGCRLGETYLNPQKQIDVLERNATGGIQKANITFRLKGGEKHTVELHHKLFPLFDELLKTRATETYSSRFGGSRDGQKRAAAYWHVLFRNSGAKEKWPGICFHCNRVTVITQLARAGVSERFTMRFVGHGSALVHRVYLRLRPDDVGSCIAALP